MNNFSRLGLLVLVIPVLGLGAGPAAGAEIAGVRFGVTSKTETRVVLDADATPTFAASVEGADSDIVVIRLEGSNFAKAAKSSGKGGGQVAGYAATMTRPASLAVRLQLDGPASIKASFSIPPSSSNPRHRIVIDLERGAANPTEKTADARKFETITDVIAAVTPTTGGNENPLVAKPPVAQEVPAPAAPVIAKRVIVIDAGHGGTDPGAAGPAGAKESAVTLAAALQLAEILKGTGRYDVVLTRKTDARLAHEERSRIARDAKASLFISLHADAHSNAKIRGGSVYTLSDEGTERSAREALSKGDYVVYDLDLGSTGKDVSGILYNLAQRDTANASDRFAELLVGKLGGVTPLLNNTHRRGNFKVLLAPDVPAVLLELAFISNKQDEANLLSPGWRKRAMGATAAAIDAYFEKAAALKHASNTASGSMR